MENKKLKKCPNHEETDAIIYCQECHINMCSKCKQCHSVLFNSHNLFSLDLDINEITSGFCKDENHNIEFEYFCKSHNKLCCAKCISKFKNKGSGKHGNCDLCLIEEIEKSKKDILNENIKVLEDLSKDLTNSIEEIKKLFEKINENKEKLKIYIQNIFTQLRNKLNKREDELLARVDKVFNRLFFKDAFIKNLENFPKKVNKHLEQGKKINKEWNKDKLSILLNNCVNIENNIKIIKSMNKKIKKYKYKNINVKFSQNDIDLNKKIGMFGNLNYYKLKYEFRQCPLDIPENKSYIVLKRKQNSLIKLGKEGWIGILCEKKLSKNRINCWKIKINKSNNYDIIVGIASNDFDSSSYYIGGWYICLCCGKLFSGAPHNYKNKDSNINFENEVILIMNMKQKSLKILMNYSETEIYSNIPIDKPLFPAIFLKDKYDSVEITDYYSDYKNTIKK